MKQKQAMVKETHQNGNHKPAQTLQEAISKANTICCFVDGSWISPEQQVGIGWSLHNKEGRQIAKADSFIHAIRKIRIDESL